MTKFTKLLVAGCAAAALWATGAAASDMKPVTIKPGTYKGKTASGKDVEWVFTANGVSSIKVGGSAVALRPGTWTDDGWWVGTEPTAKASFPPNKYWARPFTDNSIIANAGWAMRNPSGEQAQLWLVK